MLLAPQTRITNMIAAILIALTTLVSAPLTVNAKDFNADEKTAIGVIIKDYLLKNPEIIQQAIEELQKRTAEDEQKKQRKLISENQELLTNPEYSYVTGNKDGDITVIEFFDYNCPYCRQALGDITKLMENDKNVKVIFKEFPILGDASKQASLAALSARKQGKYLEFHTAILKSKGRVNDESIMKIAKQVGLDTDKLKKDMASDEIKAQLKKNLEAGYKLGINGTPTFIFNDHLVPQVLPYDAMKEVIAKLRKAS